MADTKQNRVAWLNTVRVFASFTIILSHYALLDQFRTTHANIYWAFGGIGQIGVILFLAISGYLASNSLKHSKNIWEFYRRKLIRIVIPFTTAYVILGTLFILLGILEPSLPERSPLNHIIYKGGKYLGVLYGIVPIDMNIIKLFQLPYYWFIGEWFIGMIVFMYLIAPFLEKCLRKNFILTAIGSIIVAIAMYHFIISGYSPKASLMIASWSFVVRIPQFLVGMTIFVYRDFILKHRSILNKICLSIVLVILAYSFITVDIGQPIFRGRLFIGTERDFVFSLPASYLFFAFAEWLNEKISSSTLEKFNSYSDISYMAMLIQHVVILLFAKSFDFTRLSKFGTVFMLILITGTVVVASYKIRAVYKPIEEWCIDNFLTRKRKSTSVDV